MEIIYIIFEIFLLQSLKNPIFYSRQFAKTILTAKKKIYCMFRFDTNPTHFWIIQYLRKSI